MIKKTGIIIILFALVNTGFSQISSGGRPWSFDAEIKNENIPLIHISEPEHVADPDANSSNMKPAFAGKMAHCNVDVLDAGKWIKIDDKRKLCRLKITSEAEALGLYFSDFVIPEGSSLFVYSPDHSLLLGAYNHKNNTDLGSFAIEPLPRSSIIIEFNTPVNSGDQSSLVLDGIGYFKDFDLKDSKGFGSSGPCEVNVNCPEGDAWKEQRNGVARILLKANSGLYWCTGSLVNNTRLDNTPFLLTANHCGKFASVDDYDQWIFYFNYQSETCEDPPEEPLSNSLTGAVLKAKSLDNENFGSDFKLLLLNNDVPQEFNPYYNGWSRNDVPAQNGVGIHHPQGDIKKISTYKEPLISSDYSGKSPAEDGIYWKLVWAATETNHGVTEGGSSGSPLFNENGLIVGALTGGLATCQNPTGPDYYGKFSFSWESNGTFDSLQLKPWLDPDNTGIKILAGMWSNEEKLIAAFNTSTDTIAIGGTIDFTDASIGEPDSWKWYFEGGSPAESSEENPSVSYSNFGTYDVKLIISSGDKTDSLVAENQIFVRPNILPNPANTHVNVYFGEDDASEVEIYVYNTIGKVVMARKYNVTDNVLRIELSRLDQGFYLFEIRKNNRVSVEKIMIVKNE